MSIWSDLHKVIGASAANPASTNWYGYDHFDGLSLTAAASDAVLGGGLKTASWFSTESKSDATILLSNTLANGVLEITAATTADTQAIYRNHLIRLDQAMTGGTNRKIRFGARFKVTDADDCNIYAGLGVYDAAHTGGEGADFVAFRLLDGSALMGFAAQKDSAETAVSSIGTVADDTYIRVAFEYTPTATMDTGLLRYETHTGGTYITGNFDTAGNFPDDVLLFPFFEFTNADGGTDVASIDLMMWHCECDTALDGAS